MLNDLELGLVWYIQCMQIYSYNSKTEVGSNSTQVPKALTGL